MGRKREDGLKKLRLSKEGYCLLAIKSAKTGSAKLQTPSSKLQNLTPDPDQTESNQ